jgi:hypothetical protein
MTNTPPALPAFPLELAGYPTVEDFRQHYYDKAVAWEARARLAVEELQRHTGHYECEDCWYSCATICCDERRKSDECDCGAHRVSDVLAAIGPLPPLPPTEPNEQGTGA